MNIHFEKTKNYLLELNFTIRKEIESEGIFVIEKEITSIQLTIFLGIKINLIDINVIRSIIFCFVLEFSKW